MLRFPATLCLALIAILMATDAISQISGYQGRRTILSYNGLGSPALSNYNQNSQAGIISLNRHHLFKGEYLLNRFSSIGLQSHMYRSIAFFSGNNIEYSAQHLDSDGQLVNSFADAIYFVPSQRVLYDKLNENYGELTGYSVGLFYRTYTSRIAPLGNYFQVGLDYHMFNLEPNAKAFSSPDFNAVFETYQANGFSPSSPNLNQKQNGAALAFSFEWGKQRIFWDRVVGNLGIRSSLILSKEGYTGLKKAISPNTGSEVDQRIKLEKYFVNQGRERLAALMLANIYFGIGLLVF